MKVRYAALILVGAMIAGCGGESNEPAAGDGTSPAQQPPAPTPIGANAPVPPPEMVREPAVPGVGKKGRDYGTGPVATPVSTYFRVQERIDFLTIATPMNMYRAEHGHFPKTHDEFMEEIIKKNSIKLPELSAGERYVYDAEQAARTTSYDPHNPPLTVVRDP